MSEELPFIEGDVIDGELYQLVVCNQTRDWETGIIDDYDLRFELIKGE